MIFIAGGAGYIGSHINKLLYQKGHRTVVFDNLSLGHKDFVKWGNFVLGDLSDREQIRECFLKYPIDAVMHFSAYASVEESVQDPSKYYNNNVINTINLLDTMVEFEIDSLIFSSSCAIYGIPEEVPIKETHPKNPVNPYGKSKLIVEEIFNDYDRAYGLKTISLRYFNAAGADPEGDIGERHDPETHLIPLAIYAALGKREDIKIFGTDYPTGDRTCIRDYIHVTDLADAHIRALEYLKSTQKSNMFNLGNGSGYSVKEVIETVKRVSKKDFAVVESERRPGDPPVLIADSQKATKELKWKPGHSELETIVKTAWDWHLKDI
jgi:UDP-glucose 4-epimerase